MSTLTGQSNLKPGQVPFEELIRVTKAHDVRTLRPCTHCMEFGNADSMIEHGASWFHGRCFVAGAGMKAFLALPATQTGKLPLGDLGLDIARALLESRK